MMFARLCFSLLSVCHHSTIDKSLPCYLILLRYHLSTRCMLLPGDRTGIHIQIRNKRICRPFRSCFIFMLKNEIMPLGWAAYRQTLGENIILCILYQAKGATRISSVYGVPGSLLQQRVCCIAHLHAWLKKVLHDVNPTDLIVIGLPF